jgi:hypothetical protein
MVLQGKVIVEEISSENNSDKTFKVGQIYSHPLYVYKLEISKIEAYKGESYSYRNASIFCKSLAFLIGKMKLLN